MRLGQILLQKKWISSKQLQEIIKLQTSKKNRLGQLLLQKGLIVNNQLETALKEQYPNFSQNLRLPNTEALQEVGLNRAIADFPNQQSVVRF